MCAINEGEAEEGKLGYSMLVSMDRNTAVVKQAIPELHLAVLSCAILLLLVCPCSGTTLDVFRFRSRSHSRVSVSLSVLGLCFFPAFMDHSGLLPSARWLIYTVAWYNIRCPWTRRPEGNPGQRE